MKRSDRVFAIVAAAVRALFRLRGFKNQILSQAAVAEMLTPVWHETLPSGTAMSRAVLKFAQQASLFEQATRPWLAFQYLG